MQLSTCNVFGKLFFLVSMIYGVYTIVIHRNIRDDSIRATRSASVLGCNPVLFCSASVLAAPASTLCGWKGVSLRICQGTSWQHLHQPVWLERLSLSASTTLGIEVPSLDQSLLKDCMRPRSPCRSTTSPGPGMHGRSRRCSPRQLCSPMRRSPACTCGHRPCQGRPCAVTCWAPERNRTEKLDSGPAPQSPGIPSLPAPPRPLRPPPPAACSARPPLVDGDGSAGASGMAATPPAGRSLTP